MIGPFHLMNVLIGVGVSILVFLFLYGCIKAKASWAKAAEKHKELGRFCLSISSGCFSPETTELLVYALTQGYSYKISAKRSSYGTVVVGIEWKHKLYHTMAQYSSESDDAAELSEWLDRVIRDANRYFKEAEKFRNARTSD